MSQHPQSHLTGWNGPFYPALTPDLAEAFTARPEGTGDGHSLRAALNGEPGFIRAFRPEDATDGYGWFWAFEFDVHGGKVLVALPWTQDWSCADGYMCDRSPAVYIRGGKEVNVDSANAVVARVVRALTPGPAAPNPTGR